jgi:nicotinate-nucleotide adenylyltransferase
VFVNKRTDTLIERQFADKIHKIKAPIVEVSATFVRKSIKNKKNVLPLLPYKVWKFIDEMNFYK